MLDWPMRSDDLAIRMSAGQILAYSGVKEGNRSVSEGDKWGFRRPYSMTVVARRLNIQVLDDRLL